MSPDLRPADVTAADAPPRQMGRAALGVFIVLQALTIGWIFGSCLWGKSLFTPLDVAPAVFDQYRFMNPQQGPVPANHYTIDSLTMELPLQYTIYHAIRRGEIPWWDPYTLCGTPLLADGHAHTTDWLRLLIYPWLSYELAFNWVRVGYFVIAGVGMLVLLRRMGFTDWTAVALALTYQYSGWQSLFVMHPWIPGSFMYYPWLWLVWDRMMKQDAAWHWPAATAMIAGAICSGSIQTHSYLALFGLAFAFGHARASLQTWLRISRVVVGTGILAALITAPILSAHVEFFLVGGRGVPVARNPLTLLCGVLSLSSFFPWSLGTFRTLDIGKFVGENSLGFHIFIGSPAFFLAAIGAFGSEADPRRRILRRIGIALVVLYLFVLSTPLHDILYTRLAALPTMGLIVLAGLGAERLARSTEIWRRAGLTLIGFTAVLAIAVNVAALGIYPKLIPKVKEIVASRMSTNPTYLLAPELRNFQIENLPNELSVRNPETVFAYLGLALLAVVILKPTMRRSPQAWALLACLNFIPLILFCHRFTPRHPVEMWHRMREGGPAQAPIAARMGGGSLRLWDRSPSQYSHVMTMNFPHIYRVRYVHGYAALMRGGLDRLSPEGQEQLRPWMGDWSFTAGKAGEAGTFVANREAGSARFDWIGTPGRTFTVEDIGLNEVRLHLNPGPAGEILWTDTRYPGWQVTLDGKPTPLLPSPPNFSKFAVAADTREVRFHFTPRFLKAGLVAAAVGALVLAGVSWVGRQRPARA